MAKRSPIGFGNAVTVGPGPGRAGSAGGTGASLVLEGDWARWSVHTRPSLFKGRLRFAALQAGHATGELVQDAIRQQIESGGTRFRKAGGIVANRPLTIEIKGTDTPLVDMGEMSKNVLFAVTGPFEIEWGVRRDSGSADIAAIVHEGAVIQVTPKIRGMFAALADASDGKRPASDLTGRAAELWARKPGGWKALRRSTTTIKIPARNYIPAIFANEEVRSGIANNYREVLRAAIAGEPPTFKTTVSGKKKRLPAPRPNPRKVSKIRVVGRAISAFFRRWYGGR